MSTGFDVQTFTMLSRAKVPSLSLFIARRWLVLGYLLLLTGLFWLPSGSAYTKVFYGLIATPTLFALLITPNRFGHLFREPIVLAFLVFSGWLLLSLSWSGTDEGLSSLAKRPLYILMLFAGCALIALERRELLLQTLRVAAGVATVAALVNLALFIAEPPEDGRLIGTGALRNPLLTSHVLGMFCTYWMAVWLSRDLRQDWLPILMVVSLVLALLATGSRTPLMALVLTNLLMLVMAPRRAAYLIGAIALATAVCLTFFPDLLLQRGVSYRPQIWADALRQAQEHLWIGHGYHTRFAFRVEDLGWDFSDPHNVELAVLLELGVVGLLLWLVMHGLGLWRCIRQRQDRSFQIAFAMVIYGLAAGLTEGSSFISRPNESWFLIWIPLSLVAALSISQRALGQR